MRTGNPFFGVGPITDGVADEAEARLLRFEFEAWLEQTYRKKDDRGRDIGAFTAAELGRSMHRGLPADAILLDMMRAIHRYFGFPKQNRMAVGLGGGHSGFTVCMMHLMTAQDAGQHVFVDTTRPESNVNSIGGFFRQSWATQILELHATAKGGNVERVHFAQEEGVIPGARELAAMGIKLFVGVGHETTGATTYSRQDIANLLEWLTANPAEHHAVLDATSMLGAMPWGEEVVREVMQKCCLFTPFQKAIGGVSGYYIVSFTPQALALIEANQKAPSWAIPRQLKLAAPVDARRPLTGQRTVDAGPFYDAEQDKMLGGVINTYSTLAFAETTFSVLRNERRIGDVSELNRRSTANREAIAGWIARNPLLELSVADAGRRGAAVTLIRVSDPDIADPAMHARIIARSKQLLGYEGLTHPDGSHEAGLDVARYVNAFPGTPGDYRAWIGGIRAPESVIALLENLKYAYLRGKALVLEEELAALGHSHGTAGAAAARMRVDDASQAYKILVCDLVGLRFGADGKPDASEVKAHIESRGGVFHEGPLAEAVPLAAGKLHFFYQPELAAEADIRHETRDGRYDGVIAAATPLPKDAVFSHGGVRIGAGTGNMACTCWGGGNGIGGHAVLMNTPGFNSRATAQMAMKALLHIMPDLPVDELHRRASEGRFDTGRDLKLFPTSKLEGKRLAVIGYGNIGREFAKLGQAFGMQVAVHARPRHRPWIESEGFIYADHAEDAANGADVLSLHTGLGTLDAATGKFANAGLANAAMLARLNHGAVLINYDRGELVDVDALDAALASGKVRFASIDADLFVNEDGSGVRGPLAPYLRLAARHPGRLELMPHAAADTDHPSRVAGARQAVDQMFDLIQYREVTNLKGDLPEGYRLKGSRSPEGVGAVRRDRLLALAQDDGQLARLRGLAEEVTALTAALSSATAGARREELVERHGARLVLASNRLGTLIDALGLRGPYDG